ncbi:hypothetical protein ACET3Z_021146 [Daucus carota]
MIAVYAQVGKSAEAMELFFALVRDKNVHYNSVTLSAVLLACAHSGALQVGKCLHNQAMKMGLQETVYIDEVKHRGGDSEKDKEENRGGESVAEAH